MRKRLPEWAVPMRGFGFWSGLLRVAVYSAGGVALVWRFGLWGVLALPLLIPLVWLIEAVAIGAASKSSSRGR